MPQAGPEVVRCVYCGQDTLSYQILKQVPVIKCPESFWKFELVSTEGTSMKYDDYICLDHEELFRIKYRQFQRGQSFFRGFSCKSGKGQEASVCSLCSSSDAYRYHQVDSIKALTLKNFIINELQGNKTNKKGYWNK